MEERYTIFKLEDVNAFKRKAFAFASTFSHLNFFNPDKITYPHSTFRTILFFGAKRILNLKTNLVFKSLEKEQQTSKAWLVGYFAYDLKNEIETGLKSSNDDSLNFPDCYFYEPEHAIEFLETEVRIYDKQAKKLFDKINKVKAFEHKDLNPSIQLKHKLSKTEYLESVQKIKEHILEGDFYELNFCQEFYSKNNNLENLEELYLKLCENSPSPFSVYQKINNLYLLSSSPERFLKKEKSKLISQPIKGTAPRGINKSEDEKIKKALQSNQKELAENMMIVDLVRNDFSKFAKTGSVKAEELFGIYSFQQVHQMISTITAQTEPNKSAFEIIKNLFPMGSMTGAPKKSAMQYIEKFEKSKRGLYSGAVGYISPENDFDFNVVIRSLLYNKEKDYLSLQVGSAITHDSEPEAEYLECLLKAKGIMETILHKE